MYYANDAILKYQNRIIYLFRKRKISINKR